MTGLEALMYYVLWMIALLLINIGHRIPLVLMGKTAADTWTRGNKVDDAGIIVRAGHAHLNCLENLPLFAAVVLTAVALGKAEIVNDLAAYVIYARVAQSVVHLIGTSFLLVLARATFFVIQVALVAYMAFQLLGAAGGA